METLKNVMEMGKNLLTVSHLMHWASEIVLDNLSKFYYKAYDSQIFYNKIKKFNQHFKSGMHAW